MLRSRQREWSPAPPMAPSRFSSLIPSKSNQMINFQEVSKHYPDGTVALEKVSFEVSPGEFLFVVGPSGAGKTTLVRPLTRGENPTEGELEVSGRSVANLFGQELPQHRRELGGGQ